MLKEISQQALDLSMERPASDSIQMDSQTIDNLKFIRGERMTTKMQREVYQSKVNEIFRKQIQYHLGGKFQQAQLQLVDPMTSEDIFEDIEGAEQQSVQDQSTWCVFNSEKYRKVKNIKEIPCLQQFYKNIQNLN